MPDAMLTSASISFDTEDPTATNHDPNATGGPNKDFNTNITVDVVAQDGTVVAHLSNEEGNFAYPSNEGPFALTVTETTAVKPTLVGGSVRIHIDPVGNDDWSFNAFALLKFDDGSALTGEGKGIQLSQDQRDYSISLN